MTGPSGGSSPPRKKGDAARGRVRVTHPRTQAPRRAVPRAPTREIDEQTRLGELYMASLIRSQRRLAAGVCLTVAVLLTGIAVLGAIAPGLMDVRLWGVPLPWLVLGVVIYPVLIAFGALTVRHAEQNERAFTSLVRRR